VLFPHKTGAFSPRGESPPGQLPGGARVVVPSFGTPENMKIGTLTDIIHIIYTINRLFFILSLNLMCAYARTVN
jgi:hypothetical protein